MKLWLSSTPIHLMEVHLKTQSRFTHLVVVHHTTKSRIFYWWVFNQETICRLKCIYGSPKDIGKSYTPFNDLSGRNVVLWLMHSVRHGTKVEIISALKEVGTWIQRWNKVWTELDADNYAHVVYDNASEVLMLRHFKQPSQIRRKNLS